jgi:hypothetical protein
MFCHRQKIVPCPFRIRGTFVFLCPKGREKEKDKEKEKEKKKDKDKE